MALMKFLEKSKKVIHDLSKSLKIEAGLQWKRESEI